jgi:ADP-heptose:LPS heptosyltransferase
VIYLGQCLPQFNWHCDGEQLALDIDLDAITEDQYPTEHRSDEFARILGCTQVILSPTLQVPSHWLPSKYAHSAGAIVFATEGGHPSRQWRVEKCRALKENYPNDQLVLVGTQTDTEIVCDHDLRTQLSLPALLAVLASAKVVVSMDSGILHLAAAIGVLSVAIFGGINPVYRVRKTKKWLSSKAHWIVVPVIKKKHVMIGLIVSQPQL